MFLPCPSVRPSIHGCQHFFWYKKNVLWGFEKVWGVFDVSYWPQLALQAYVTVKKCCLRGHHKLTGSIGVLYKIQSWPMH